MHITIFTFSQMVKASLVRQPHCFLFSDVTDDQLGGGYYSSDNATLACMREDIDQQPHQFKSVLMNDNLRKTFFPGMKDEKKVVAAFCKMSGDNALKTKPKVCELPGFGNHGLGWTAQIP